MSTTVTTPNLFPPRGSTNGTAPEKPIDAPTCAERAAEALAAARDTAEHVINEAGGGKVAALVDVARGYRELGVALSQHQGMTPRPPDDDRGQVRRR